MIQIKGWDGHSLIQRVFAYNINYDLATAANEPEKLATLKERLLRDQTFYLPEELWNCLDASRIQEWILQCLEVATGFKVKDISLEAA